MWAFIALFLKLACKFKIFKMKGWGEPSTHKAFQANKREDKCSQRTHNAGLGQMLAK